jgi:hypothetical protein
MLRHTLFLTAFTISTAPIASPNPTSRFKAAEPSGLPADWRQPVTFAKESAPVLKALAESQGEPAMPEAPSGVPIEAEKAAAFAKEALIPIANLIILRVHNNTNFGVGRRGSEARMCSTFNR